MVDRKISADSSLPAGSIAGTDLIPVVDISEPADADKNKNITFTILETYLNSNLNFNNYSHPNHTGHVSSSGDGATTLLVASITGQTALTTGLTGTDELLISDGGVIKRMDVSVMNAYFNANLSFLSAPTLSGVENITGETAPWFPVDINDFVFEVGGTVYSSHATNAGTLIFSGGNSGTGGGSIVLYGGNHGSFAYDILFRGASGVTKLSYDDSDNEWTFVCPVLTAATGALGAGFRLPHGTAPSSPVNGDIWTTTSSIFARINGVTEDLLAGGGEALWQEQNTSITGTKGSRYVKASGASHTITLPTNPNVNDDPNFVAVWNNDTDTSTVTVDPNGTNSLYLKGTNLGSGVAVVLQPGQAVLCVGRQTSNTAWDVMYISGGLTGVTDNSTVVNMTINDGNVTFEDEIIIDNVGLTVDNTFLLGAYNTSTPKVQFDTNDMIIYNRSLSYFEFLMGGGDRHRLDYYYLRSEGPWFSKELAADLTDQAGYGQFWVEDWTPNEPRFTDDTGQITPLGRRLNPSPPDDHTASGTIANMEVGATVAFGDLLHMDTDGQLILADADAIATMPVFAMALESGVATNFIDVLLSGFVRDDTWVWATVGAPVYASTTAGDFTTTVPTGAGDVVQVLGTVTHADRIYFNPSPDWIEL